MHKAIVLFGVVSIIICIYICICAMIIKYSGIHLCNFRDQQFNNLETMLTQKQAFYVLISTYVQSYQC